MSKKLFSLLVLSSFLFVLFILFSYVVQKDALLQLDFDATVRLQDNVSRRFDTLFSWFSFIGNFEVTLVVLLIILAAVRKVVFGIVAFFLFGLFHIIELFGKTFVENIPPPEFLLRTERLVDFPQFHVRSEFSYPSGHSGRTIFLSVLLLFFILRSKKLPNVVKVFLVSGVLLFDFIMLLSRVYLGEHWLTDVIGGILLGGAMACGSLFFARMKLPRFGVFSHKK